MVQASACGGHRGRKCFFYQLKTDLVEAIRVYTRYEIPTYGKDETRRERNKRVGEFAPELNIPSDGYYIWEWFIDLNNAVSRIKDGICYMIPPSEYLAWCKLTGNIVYPVEYDILKSMDEVFCRETNLEIESVRSRQQEEQQRQVEESRMKRR